MVKMAAVAAMSASMAYGGWRNGIIWQRRGGGVSICGGSMASQHGGVAYQYRRIGGTRNESVCGGNGGVCHGVIWASILAMTKAAYQWRMWLMCQPAS